MVRVRQDVKEETRAALIRAGMELFRSQGFPETTVEQITALAGTAKGTFYNYFRTKEELACAGVEAEQAAWYGKAGDILAGVHGPGARLKAIFISACGWMAANAQLGMIWSLERLRKGRPAGRWSSLHEAVNMVVEEAQRAGLVTADRPSALLSLDLMGLFLAYSVAWYHSGGSFDLAAAMAAAVHNHLWGALTPLGRQEENQV